MSRQRLISSSRTDNSLQKECTAPLQVLLVWALDSDTCHSSFEASEDGSLRSQINGVHFHLMPFYLCKFASLLHMSADTKSDTSTGKFAGCMSHKDVQAFAWRPFLCAWHKG